MKKCICCILEICAVLMGIITVALIVMSYLGIDPLGNSKDDEDDIPNILPLYKRIPGVKRSYTELKPLN